MKKITTSITLILLILLSSLTKLQAANIFVNQSATSGGNNGTSWENAYLNLQSALAIAIAGDKIYVAKGIYIPSNQVDTDGSGATEAREVTFNIPTGVELYGGFAGNESPIDQSVLDARNFTTNETILTGDLMGNDNVSGTFPNLSYNNYAENAYHVVYTKNVGSGLVFDGFTITGGNADGSNENRFGGGWYNVAEGAGAISQLTIRNTKFYRNRISGVEAYGAGLYNAGISDNTNTNS